jgi:hypothetical protein
MISYIAIILFIFGVFFFVRNTRNLNTYSTLSWVFGFIFLLYTGAGLTLATKLSDEISWIVPASLIGTIIFGIIGTLKTKKGQSQSDKNSFWISVIPLIFVLVIVAIFLAFVFIIGSQHSSL